MLFSSLKLVFLNTYNYINKYFLYTVKITFYVLLVYTVVFQKLDVNLTVFLPQITCFFSLWVLLGYFCFFLAFRNFTTK